MQRVFPTIKQPKILVIGDLILDHTIFGEAKKLANEAPLPVLNQKSEIYTLGGCGNVASNLAALGASVTLCSAIGNDENGSRVLQLLKQNMIEWNGITLDDYPTTIKHRGFEGSKLLFRYDREHTSIHQKTLFDIQYNWSEYIKKSGFNAVVFSDYNKGICTYDLVRVILQTCIKMSIQTIVDPKGDFKKYKGCTLIKPNQDEAARFYKESGLPSINECQTPEEYLERYHLRLKLLVEPKYSCITRAKDGISLFNVQSDIYYKSSTQSIDIIDVTGAGDIVTAVAAYCLATGIDLQTTINAASFLATQSVQHRGTYVLKPSDIWLLRMHLRATKRISQSDLAYIPRDKSIVFTNGCFDLLHSGHISSIKFAKEQGDILVLGINSDESISRLKGSNRPIQTLDERIAMLEAISFIDYIIPFEKDSPKEIVTILKPNILVKGEDYKDKNMSSAEFAEKIVFAPLKPQTSTSSLIARILDKCSFRSTLM
jgi:D-beta-D-heptose 7-phosphate kinase/D-beta-D-heptose 1-phosphate adenosyltransferase